MDIIIFNKNLPLKKPFMKNLFSFKTTIYVFAMFSFVSFSMISCGKDDNKKESCTAFPSLGGTISINGADQDLSIAQYLAASNSYGFQLAGVSPDCLGQTIVSLNTFLSPGATLGGTYAIKPDFPDDNEFSATITKQRISPVSQSLEELVSGSVTIVNNGANDFNINLTGKTVGGEDVKVSVRHKF